MSGAAAALAWARPRLNWQRQARGRPSAPLPPPCPLPLPLPRHRPPHSPQRYHRHLLPRRRRRQRQQQRHRRRHRRRRRRSGCIAFGMAQLCGGPISILPAFRFYMITAVPTADSGPLTAPLCLPALPCSSSSPVLTCVTRAATHDKRAAFYAICMRGVVHYHLWGAGISHPVWDIPAFGYIPGGVGISQEVEISQGGWDYIPAEVGISQRAGISQPGVGYRGVGISHPPWDIPRELGYPTRAGISHGTAKCNGLNATSC